MSKLHPRVADITTAARRTTGDVPPPLVGSSTTVMGSKTYLFGGRLEGERNMTMDMYAFDMDTYVWTKISYAAGDELPTPRYFHSTEPWKHYLIVFGGMVQDPQSRGEDTLCVLNDVRVFDTHTFRWLPLSATNPSRSPAAAPAFVPAPRYAHVASITASRLFIIGGQDLDNQWIDEVLVYDLEMFSWIDRRALSLHCGVYRSIAVAAKNVVRYPKEEIRSAAHRGISSASVLGPLGTRFRTEQVASSEPECTPTEALIHLPYSAEPTDNHPSDIYLYSNSNIFSDVKREFEILSPLPRSSSGSETFTQTDASARVTGSPPGLRFPTGVICGEYLLVAGTDFERVGGNGVNDRLREAYSIWTLHLPSLNWSRIETGRAMEKGSWGRMILHSSPSSNSRPSSYLAPSPSTPTLRSTSASTPPPNRLLVFGNRAGSLADDYQKRLVSFADVAIVELEAFGIYQPPSLLIQPVAQEFGLAMLEESIITDFEVVCEDGRRIKCSRRLLEERWPWFKSEREAFVERARSASEGLPMVGAHVPLPYLDPTPTTPTPSASRNGNPKEADVRPDPRLTPRSLKLPDSYPTTLAFLQYLYAQALITPLQHAPGVLAQLLLLATTYEIPHLRDVVKHAMHRTLKDSTSVGIYEVATLCGCESLQVRALKAVMKGNSRSRARAPAGSRSASASRSHSGGGSISSASGRLPGTSDTQSMQPSVTA